MNAIHASITHAANSGPLPAGQSRRAIGAANIWFAPVCTGF
ncbi:hypothetical protein [Piscinibacter sakaiensis]